MSEELQLQKAERAITASKKVAVKERPMPAFLTQINPKDLQENPVRAAHSSCVVPSSGGRKQLNNWKTKLVEFKKSLLACESVAKDRANRLLEMLERCQLALSDHPALAKEYDYFDFQTAFDFRDQNGYPLLAVYNIYGNGECSFNIFGNGSNLFFPESLRNFTPIENAFRDVFEKLAFEMRSNESRRSISSILVGVVPAANRQIIQNAWRSKSFDDIYVLAQAQWNLEVVRATPNTDPLVIGLKDNTAWLITAFDLTSMEEEVLKSCSFGA